MRAILMRSAQKWDNAAMQHKPALKAAQRIFE
jgi:hypothetical protein